MIARKVSGGIRKKGREFYVCTCLSRKGKGYKLKEEGGAIQIAVSSCFESILL